MAVSSSLNSPTTNPRPTTPSALLRMIARKVPDSDSATRYFTNAFLLRDFARRPNLVRVQALVRHVYRVTDVRLVVSRGDLPSRGLERLRHAVLPRLMHPVAASERRRCSCGRD